MDNTRSMDVKDSERFAALLAEQQARRTTFYRYHDAKELRAMRDLARQIFGVLGLLEANPEEPGVVYLGRYERDDREQPSQNRKRKLFLRGNSHRELVDQAKLLGLERRFS